MPLALLVDSLVDVARCKGHGEIVKLLVQHGARSRDDEAASKADAAMTVLLEEEEAEKEANEAKKIAKTKAKKKPPQEKVTTPSAIRRTKRPPSCLGHSLRRNSAGNAKACGCCSPGRTPLGSDVVLSLGCRLPSPLTVSW